MIAIVNYGVGNLASIANMFRAAGVDAAVTADPTAIGAASHLVLPGVGHFDEVMRRFNASGLRPTVAEAVQVKRTPVLGICVGAQILGAGSAEGAEPGLGWVPMHCVRFTDAPGVRVPHIGWRRIQVRGASPIFAHLAADARFYFVHSYHFVCDEPGDIAATAQYAGEFTASVQRGHIFGVQFHPEKSLRHGMTLLKAFGEVASP